MVLEAQSEALASRALLGSLRAFCLPGGEAAALRVRAIRTTQIGEMRMSEAARWIPFTADETIEATCSSFRWEARLDPAKIGSPTVIDAYEEGRGRLVVKLGGVLPIRKITGLDADRGELQRYLASILSCPPILLNHPSLEWSAIGAGTLRVGDRADVAGASVAIDLNEQGRPLVCRADRPRIVGKEAILTHWSATGADFREYEGLRIPSHLEAAWHLPEETFTYFRAEITSLKVIRESGPQ